MSATAPSNNVAALGTAAPPLSNTRLFEERHPGLRVTAPAGIGPRDAWDWLLCSVILAGLPALLYLSVHNGLFRPLLAEAEVHQWMRLILLPPFCGR